MGEEQIKKKSGKFSICGEKGSESLDPFRKRLGLARKQEVRFEESSRKNLPAPPSSSRQWSVVTMSSVQILLDSDDVAKYPSYQTVYYIVADNSETVAAGDDCPKEIYQVQTVVPEVVQYSIFICRTVLWLHIVGILCV